MNDIIYLEPDAEITSVIDKIKKSQGQGVVLVIPRGGTLAQSIINLKLLMRSAREHSKAIALVTSEKTSMSLAKQLKIDVFSKVSEAEKVALKFIPEDLKRPVEKKSEESLSKVNPYKRYSLANLNADGETIEEVESEEELDHEEQEFQTRKIEIEANDDYDPDVDYDEHESSDEDTEETSKPVVESRKLKVESDEDDMSINGDGVKSSKKHIKTEGSRGLFFAIFIVILLLIAGGVSAYFLPKVSTTLVLKTREVDETLSLVVNKDGSSQDGVMAVKGTMLNDEKDVSKSYPATGKKNIGQKATGTVTIYNSLNYQSAVKLNSGTKITSSSGKVFDLQADATVPVAVASAVIVNGMPTLKTTPGSVDVAVSADQSGTDYNLTSTKFTIAGYTNNSDKFYAQNSAAFSGGTTQEVNIVTEDDLKNAETALTADTLTTACTELTSKANDSHLKILISQISNNIISEQADKNVGDQADNFNFSMKIEFFVLGFSEDDVKAAVISGVAKKITDGEMIINPESSNITYTVSNKSLDNGEMDISAVLKGEVGKKISADDVRGALQNKSLGSARSYLSGLDGVQSYSLNIWPSLWFRTPFILNRITVNFSY